MPQPSCVSKSKLPLNPHQVQVVDFLQRKHVRGLLVFHSVGSGKTLTGVTVSQCFLAKNPNSNVIVVTPVSLQRNFIKELRQYGADPDDSRYLFFTIQGFANSFKNGEFRPVDCENSLLIIDEAHNLRTSVPDMDDTDEQGSYEGKSGVYARALLTAAKHAAKVLLMTATPLVNRPSEIINLISMVDGVNPMTLGQFDQIKDFEKYFKCKISFYEEPASQRKKFYPMITDQDVFLEMPSRYYKKYARLEQKPTKSEQAFYNGVRRGSNAIEDQTSPKVRWIMSHLAESNPEEQYVIFSHFLGKGLQLLMDRMKNKHVKFAEVTGDMSMTKRSEAVDAYNKGAVKVLLISKAGGEGLDLKKTRNVILMEPSWNESTHAQVIGRAARYKSHIDLPESKRKVDVFRLFLVKPNETRFLKKACDQLWLKEPNKEDDHLSVDLYLRNFALQKQQVIDDFVRRLKASSIEHRKCSGQNVFVAPKVKPSKKAVKGKSRKPKASRKAGKSPRKAGKSPRKPRKAQH